MQIIIVPDVGDAGHKQADYAARQIRDTLEDVEVSIAYRSEVSSSTLEPAGFKALSAMIHAA